MPWTRCAPFLVLMLCVASAPAAEPTTTTTATTAAAPSTEATTAPSTAPASRRAGRVVAAIADIPNKIQETASLLKQVDNRVAGDRVTTNIDQDLDDVTTEITTRLQEGPNLAAAP